MTKNDQFDDGVTFETKEVALTREMGTFHVALLGYGAMVGASIFILAGTTMGYQIGNNPVTYIGAGVIIAIILNYFVSLVTALNYAELSSGSPEVGGGYLWVKEATNDTIGFVSGWISWLGHSIACAFYILVINKGILWLFNVDENSYIFGIHWGIISTAIAIIIAIFFLWINYRGVSSTGRAEFLIVLVQVGVLVIFSLLAIIRSFETPNSLSAFSSMFSTPFTPVVVIMGVLFIAFEGYEICAQAGEEAVNPEKTIPKAIVISLTALFFTYMLVFVSAIAGNLEPTIIQGQEEGLIFAGDKLLPFILGPVMIIAMIFGAVATLNATIYSSSRVALALSRDNNLPKQFLKIHPTTRTPWVAIWGSGGLIIFIVIFLNLKDVIASADIMFLLLFTLVNYSAIILRRRKGDFPFKTPFFPSLPITGLITKFLIAIFLYIYSPTAWYVATVWVILGLIIKCSSKNVRYIKENFYQKGY